MGDYFSSHGCVSPLFDADCQDGTVRYFHHHVTPVVVSPGRSTVFPLVPEFIVPQDTPSRTVVRRQNAGDDSRPDVSFPTGSRSWAMTSIVTNRCVKPCCTSRSTSSWSACRTRTKRCMSIWRHCFTDRRAPTLDGKTEETYTYRYLNQVLARRRRCPARQLVRTHGDARRWQTTL